MQFIKEHWNGIRKILTALLIVCYTFLAYQVARYAIGYSFIFIFGVERYRETFWYALIELLTYALVIVLVAIVPKFIDKKYKSSRKDLGLTELPTFTDIGISLLGYVATFFIAGILISFLNSLNLIQSSGQQDIGFEHLYSGLERSIAFITIAIIAPVAEEIIFRGFLYGKLRKELKIIPAILITSVLFGFLHGQLDVGIYVGILSVILCLEREITGTIYAGIITHMIQNSVAFGILILQGRF